MMQNDSLAFSTKPRVIDSALRNILFRHLDTLSGGCITIADGDARRTFGDQRADLRATVFVHSSRFYRRFVFGGGLGAAEALIEGDWSCDDLTALVRIFIRNMNVSDSADRGWARLRRLVSRLQHRLRRNTRSGASRNIHAHYDLGNDLYRLFLDETMSYSCGVFEEPQATMYDASIAKMERVCLKLDLRPSDHLVEIGSGGGGLAIYAAENFGCRVTTTTISREQFELANHRVRQAGLSDRVTVLLQDYRDLEGQFDKLVSIEMIEAVGHEYFDTFFNKCSELLTDDGLMLLQSIVIKEQRYKEHLRSVDFIRKYIFPGGCLPSVAVLLRSTASVTDLRLLHAEDVAPHYAQTLRCWSAQFNSRLDDVRELGFSESFIRMWNYYFSYCEAVFEERQCNNVQIVFAKPKCRFDSIGSTAWVRRSSKFSAEDGWAQRPEEALV